jgi:hypothetical protein
MSSKVVIPARTNGKPAVADTRTLQRWVAALLMPIGPAAVALLRFTIPYDGLDTPATIVSKVAASPAAQSAVLWLGLVALFTLVPGAFAVLKLVRPRAPWLSLTGAALLIPGYLGLFGAGAGADLYVYVGTRAGIDRGLLADLLQLATGHPTVAIAGFVFVAGHILGSIALGLALWRSATVHWVWAAAMTVSQPLHLYAALTGHHRLDLFAWGLTAAAMAAAAVAVIRLPNDQWDVPPATGS